MPVHPRGLQPGKHRMSAALAVGCHVRSRMLLPAFLAITGTGCADAVVVSRDEATPRPQALGWELTPLQQGLLLRPSSPHVDADRAATRADLEEARSWFGPGELATILTIVNRSARARGADTVPHCIPLCAPGIGRVEHGTR